MGVPWVCRMEHTFLLFLTLLAFLWVYQLGHRPSWRPSGHQGHANGGPFPSSCFYYSFSLPFLFLVMSWNSNNIQGGLERYTKRQSKGTQKWIQKLFLMSWQEKSARLKNSNKNLINDWIKTFTENWVGRQSFFVLILTSAQFFCRDKTFLFFDIKAETFRIC